MACDLRIVLNMLANYAIRMDIGRIEFLLSDYVYEPLRAHAHSIGVMSLDRIQYFHERFGIAEEELKTALADDRDIRDKVCGTYTLVDKINNAMEDDDPAQRFAKVKPLVEECIKLCHTDSHMHSPEEWYEGWLEYMSVMEEEAGLCRKAE